MKRNVRVILCSILICVFLTTFVGCKIEEELRKLNLFNNSQEQENAAKDTPCIEGTIVGTPYVAYTYTQNGEMAEYVVIANSVEELQEIDREHGGFFFQEDLSWNEKLQQRIQGYDEVFFDQKEVLIISMSFAKGVQRVLNSVEFSSDGIEIAIEKPCFDDPFLSEAPFTYFFIIELDKTFGKSTVAITTEAEYNEEAWRIHSNYDSYAPVQKDQTTVILPDGQNTTWNYCVYMEFLPLSKSLIFRTYEEFLTFLHSEGHLGDLVWDSLKDEYTEEFFENKCLAFTGVRYSANNLPVTSVKIENNIIKPSVIIDYRPEKMFIWDVQAKYTIFIELDKEYVNADTTIQESIRFGTVERDMIMNRRTSFTGKRTTHPETYTVETTRENRNIQ